MAPIKHQKNSQTVQRFTSHYMWVQIPESHKNPFTQIINNFILISTGFVKI